MTGSAKTSAPPSGPHAGYRRGARSRDTGIAMKTQHIKQQNILRVLIAGFGLVILLLLAAAVVGVYNIQSIQQNAASLVREQAVTNGLIAELQRQHTRLRDGF